MILSLAILIRCIVKKKKQEILYSNKKNFYPCPSKLLRQKKEKERRNLRNVIKN